MKYSKLGRNEKQISTHRKRHAKVALSPLPPTGRYLHLTINDLKEAHRKYHPRKKGFARRSDSATLPTP